MSNGWAMVKLSEIAALVARPVSVEPGKTYRTIGVKWWGQGAYDRGAIDGSQTAAKTLSLVHADDLIINKIWVRHGSTAVAGPDVDGCAASGEFPTFMLTPSRVIPRWLHWHTKTKAFWAECDALSRGTSGKNRIRPDLFLTIRVPLPPLAEQRRIVAKIDQLAAKIVEARDLRASSLTATASLWASSLAAALPRRAETKRLGDLIDPDSRISYGVLVPGPDVEGGVPFVRVQDLDVRNPPEMPNKRISAAVDAQYGRTHLAGGEVLVGVVGSIGKIGIAPESWAGANIARAVCRISVGPKIDPYFLAAVLQSSQCQDYFRDTTRTLAQPTLNVAQLAETPIPVPPLPEQRRIVAHLDGLQAKVDRLKELQAQTAAELDALLPSILDRAFKGEL